MNELQRLREELKNRTCPTCHGLGHCDDADLGDIFYRTWTCPDCNGTGLKTEGTKK
jgi:DnaJ-class molecular chaperone